MPGWSTQRDDASEYDSSRAQGSKIEFPISPVSVLPPLPHTARDYADNIDSLGFPDIDLFNDKPFDETGVNLVLSDSREDDREHQAKSHYSISTTKEMSRAATNTTVNMATTIAIQREQLDAMQVRLSRSERELAAVIERESELESAMMSKEDGMAALFEVKLRKALIDKQAEMNSNFMIKQADMVAKLVFTQNEMDIALKAKEKEMVAALEAKEKEIKQMNDALAAKEKEIADLLATTKEEEASICDLIFHEFFNSSN